MYYKISALVVFVLVYGFLAISKRYRATALWVGVLVLLLLGVYSADATGGVGQRAVASAVQVFRLINWNVMGIFAGVLIVAEFFVLSKVPVRLSDILIDRSKNVGQAMLLVCLLTSVVSIFVENVVAVLIIAPLALQLSRRLKISAIPFLTGIAIASNLQGTATLIGDPPSMILAGEMNLSFNDFFFLNGKPSIFFAVQAGALASFIVLWLVYRKYKQPTFYVEKEPVTSWVPTVLLAALVAALSTMPVLERLGVHPPAGLVCMIFGAITFGWGMLRDRAETLQVLRKYDYPTVSFLMGVFALVGVLGLPHVGLIEDIQRLITSLVGDSRLLAFLIIVGFSVMFSAFVDNVPYLTAMLPVVKGISMQETGMAWDPLLAFGLLVGACLGGNITPVGAAANVVSVGLLRREGEHVGFWQFMKIGLPFTLAATVTASAFLWLVWK